MKAMMEELIAPKPNPIIDPKASTVVSPPITNPSPLLNFVPEKDKVQEEEKLGEPVLLQKGRRILRARDI
jgi:hypothetical protein